MNEQNYSAICWSLPQSAWLERHQKSGMEKDKGEICTEKSLKRAFI